MSHSVMGMGPLFAGLYIAWELVPRASLPSWAGPFSRVALMAVVSLGVVHNRFAFPYGLTGSLAEQSVRLTAPRTLAGLRVSPDFAVPLSAAAEVLHRSGFEPSRDLLLAAYNLPGLVVGLDARALGTEWLGTWPAGTQEAANCMLVQEDATDLAARGRVFLVQNVPLTPAFTRCLEARGLQLVLATALGTIPVDGLRSFKVSRIPVRAR